MTWIIPGTTLESPRSEADNIASLFESMFLPGGMVLSQVASISGLEPYTVQNWVKRGFLSPPQGKRYTMRQLCRILNINMLKGALTMEQICGLLGYINGQLDDESDDLIDDSQLYFMFVRLAVRSRNQDQPQQWHQAIDQVLEGYQEPVSGARERITQVLKIMLMAWFATKMRQRAVDLLAQLPQSD